MPARYGSPCARSSLIGDVVGGCASCLSRLPRSAVHCRAASPPWAPGGAAEGRTGALPGALQRSGAGACVARRCRGTFRRMRCAPSLSRTHAPRPKCGCGVLSLGAACAPPAVLACGGHGRLCVPAWPRGCEGRCLRPPGGGMARGGGRALSHQTPVAAFDHARSFRSSAATPPGLIRTWIRRPRAQAARLSSSVSGARRRRRWRRTMARRAWATRRCRSWSSLRTPSGRTAARRRRVGGLRRGSVHSDSRGCGAWLAFSWLWGLAGRGTRAHFCLARQRSAGQQRTANDRGGKRQAVCTK